MDGGGISPDDELGAQGLFVDDIHRIRILEPTLADRTLQLKTEADHFLRKTSRFDEMVETFKKEAGRTAQAVETEKRRALGYRLLLDSLRKKREQDQRRLMALVDRKRLELERLRVETEMLNKADHFHQEILDQFQMLH